MKGNIQIIQNYGDSQKVVFQAENMAVDGVRKTIADVMTYMPNPSGDSNSILRMEPGVSSVSSYQIQAMSLGSAKGYYNKRDSRFWYSAMEYSSYNYQQATLKPADYFEMFDCYSGIGYNSWKYDSTVDANILQSPTLNNLNDWNVTYKVPDDVNNPAVSQEEVNLEGSVAQRTRFELTKGQQGVTISQRVPLRLGENYYLYTNGKAYEATFDFRIGRGRDGLIFEYYDFARREFIEKPQATLNTRRTTLLTDIFEVDEFRFKLKGNEVDQALETNNEYYVEYVFPAKSFIDKNFSPWEENTQNPYVDIVRLELCDASHQILQNPNFLTHQSIFLNNNFKHVFPVSKAQAVKPGLCNALGYRQILGWHTVNPILNSDDPGTEEFNGDLGSIKPVVTSHLENTVFSSMSDGLVLYTSGTDLSDSSGGVALYQSIGFGDTFRNPYAFPTLLSPSPTSLNVANGQADNSKTLMLSFDTMVSSSDTAANSGHLEVTLLRNSDGYKYAFSANTFTSVSNKFESENIPLIVPYTEKDSWLQVAAPVMFPADANRDSYTLTIKGSGRTDTNGFCNYAIKDFSFGELQGWRTYLYDQSSVGSWTLSSNTYSPMTSGFIYSGLSFSGPHVQSYGWSGGYIEAVNNSKTKYKNQIVQNFHGLAPTKSYRLSLKGGWKTGTSVIDDAFQAVLKARGRVYVPGGNNILGEYTKDISLLPLPAATPTPVSNLNPYSNNGQSFRRTYPSFEKTLDDFSTKPGDWGVLLTASANQLFFPTTGGIRSSTAAFEDSRGDRGDYYLSMDVFNSHEEGSYFVLSSFPNAFFNWDTHQWNNISAPLPSYRSSTSGAYFLPLPSSNNAKDYTSFEYPYPIDFQSTNLMETSEPTPDGDGVRGAYKITAGLFGPNAPEGETLVKNIKLVGAGEGPHVDAWKDLYYHWDTGEWKVEYDAGSIKSSVSDSDLSNRNFIATPSKDISNMCLYGLDKDTQYQLNIINVSGGEFILNDVALTDTSLIANSGKDRWIRDDSIFTSEFYGNTHYAQYANETVIKYYSTLGDVFDPSTVSTPVPATPAIFDSNITLAATPRTQSSERVPVITFPDVNTNTPRYPWLFRSFTLDEYDLQGGELFACGFDVALTQQEGTPQALVAAQVENRGMTYQYDFNSKTWVPGSSRREKSFDIKLVGTGITGGDTLGVSSMQDVTQFTKVATPDINSPHFGPQTKIIVSMRIVPNSANESDVIVKDFRVYKVIQASREDTLGYTDYRVSGDTFLFPEFPTPMDESLQSKGSPRTPRELGHFLNRIQYFDFSAGQGHPSKPYSSIQCIGNPMAPSKTGEVTMEEAVAMGAYLPSGGLYFKDSTLGTYTGSGLLSGTLNTMGVLNSDGYIYQHPHSPTNEFDASAGFVTSSYVMQPYAAWTHKPKVVRYILKVHKDDWKFLDYYMGGIGALGLHTFDYKKTYEKLGTSMMLSSTDETYSQGSRVALYNVADPSRNPVFRLTNKKVTFAPGLHIDDQNMDWLTIIWDIDFLN